MFQREHFKTITLINILAIFICLGIFGCGVDSNKPHTPAVTEIHGAYTSAEDVINIIKKYGDIIPSETRPSDLLMAPSSGEWEISQLINVKKEGQVMILDVPGVEKQVRLRVKEDALNKPTEISMRLYLEVIPHDPGKDEIGTLYFEFGPSGTQFAIPAVLRIPFGLLLTDGVDTFMITDENGDEIAGVSYDIDYEEHFLITYIPHFSSYYFSRR